MRPLLPIAAALGLALAACGLPGKEAELMKQRGNICGGAAANGLTLLQVEQQLENTPYKIVTNYTTTQPLADDHCDLTQPLTLMLIGFYPNDPGLCSSDPTGGCVYACELRSTQTDFDAHYTTDQQVPICGSQWFTKLAIPP